MADINKPTLNKLRNNIKNTVFKQSCSENNLALVEEMIEKDTEFKLDLNKGLLKACENGSLTVLKYLLETPNIKEKIDLNAEFDPMMGRSLCNEALINSYMNSQSEIVDYLLFEINIDISERTRKSLKLSGSQDLINKIEKRDLFFQLNAKEKNQNIDSKKIKI